MVLNNSKFNLIRNIYYKKIFSSLIVIFLLFLSFNHSSASKVYNEEDKSYGFIITYERVGNFTIIDQINCKIRHMINDVLREKINVYWTAENITAKISKIYPKFNNESKFFESGSFIIPFTGNITDDKKIISIIYDYNQTSEIEINNDLKIPVYILLEHFSVESYPLNDVKIAQTYSRITTGDFLFLQLTNKCGFLNYETLKDDQVYENLKLEKYNVLFHPGGIHDTFHLLTHMIFEDILYKKSCGIRSFVNDGGGYIGSCGGLTKSCAGGVVKPFPIPIDFRRKVYNPNLRSIGVSAICDIFITNPPKVENPVKIIIKKPSSPIAYSLDGFVWDSWLGGPKVYNTGEKVEVIGKYYNTNTEIDGTPAWLTTKFGKGKVVTFSTHPEISGVPFKTFNESMLNAGKIAIANSLYYTTCEEKIKFKPYFSKNLNYIYEIFEKTANLTNDTYSTDMIFNPIREKIENTKNYINNIKDDLSETISLIENIANKYNVNLTDSKNKYFLGIDYIYDIRFFYLDEFLDYFNESFKVFFKIELINEFLKNVTNFTKELNNLFNYIYVKINETNEIINKIKEKSESFKKNLLDYKKKILRSRYKENKLKLESNSIYTYAYSGFSKVPQIYFNSLKLLRNQWYNYEANI
jgi:hypothetical protein